jgi:hypothetical protein
MKRSGKTASFLRVCEIELYTRIFSMMGFNVSKKGSKFLTQKKKRNKPTLGLIF